MIHKNLSPAFFGAVLICFFLPWVNVSCQGQKIATFSGIQLVSGTTIEEPTMFGAKQKRKVQGEVFAMLAFLAAIVGFGVSFLKVKRVTTYVAAAGVAGTTLLLMLTSKLNNDIQETAAMLQLEYLIGFYLTLIGFLSATAINVYLTMQDKGTSLPLSKDKADNKFCSQCGAIASPDSAFCSECGHTLKGEQNG